jgi:hypothetical protein
LVGVKLDLPLGTGFIAGLIVEVAKDLGTTVDALISDLPLAEHLARDLRTRGGTLGTVLDVVGAYKTGASHPALSMTDVVALHGQAAASAVGVIAIPDNWNPPLLALPEVARESGEISPSPVVRTSD